MWLIMVIVFLGFHRHAGSPNWSVYIIGHQPLDTSHDWEGEAYHRKMVMTGGGFMALFIHISGDMMLYG